MGLNLSGVRGGWVLVCDGGWVESSDDWLRVSDEGLFTNLYFNSEESFDWLIVETTENKM